MKIIIGSKRFKNNSKEILVDDEDYELLSKYNWSINYKNKNIPIFVRGKVNGKHIMLSRFLLNPPRNKVVDHINGNIFDNQKSNLRICTQAQNTLNRKMPNTNTTGFKGVYIEKITRKDKTKYTIFASMIVFKGKMFRKRNKDINICIKWRKDMEEKLFREFRRAN